MEKKLNHDSEQLNDEQPKVMKNSWICTLTICLSVSSVMLSTGIAVGTFNVSSPSLTAYFNQTYQERNNGSSLSSDFGTTLQSLGGSAMLAGGFVGSTCSGLVLTRVGRKWSCLGMNLLNLLAALVMGVVTFRLGSYRCFIVGRLVFGVFCGFGMNLIPMIVAESSVLSRQAFYLSLIGVNLSGGGLIGLCMGFESVLGYCLPALLSLSGVPSVVYLLACKWFVVDSPYTLVREGKREAAVAALTRLRHNADVREINEVLDEVQHHLHISSTTKTASVIDVFKTPRYRRILLVVLILFLQAQLCGINGLGMYTVSIFQAADFSKEHAETATTIVYAVQFVVALGGSYAIDRLGPKRLNLVSSYVMSCTLLLLTISMSYSHLYAFKIVSVASVTIYVLSWACGVNLTLFPMLAAYTTDYTREATFSFGGGVFWFFSWFVSFIFLYLLGWMGAFAFLPFSILNLLFGLLVHLRMPETRGRSALDITDQIQGVKNKNNKNGSAEQEPLEAVPIINA